MVDEAVAVEDRVHRADGWRLHLAVGSAQLLADLGGTPAGPIALELNDELLDLPVLREISKSRQTAAIFSPSSKRATNRSRSSIWQHSFQGTFALPQSAEVLPMSPE